MPIDFDAFTKGARAAKEDYWTDIKNSQGAVLRDVAMQDGLRMVRDKQEQEAAASYLSPMLMDQQRAAASGTNMTEWYQNAMNAVLNDEGLRQLSPEVQQRVMQGLRTHGVKLANELNQSGDARGALDINKLMGTNFGPANRGDTSEIFRAYNMEGAGFTEDKENGVWRNVRGQAIPAAQAAQLVLQQGPAGILTAQSQWDDYQRQVDAGLASGGYTEGRDQYGNRMLVRKNPVDMAMDTRQLRESYNQRLIQDAVNTGGLDFGDEDSVRRFINYSGDAGMQYSLDNYLRGGHSSAPMPQTPAPMPQTPAPMPQTPAPAGQPYSALQQELSQGLLADTSAFGGDAISQLRADAYTPSLQDEQNSMQLLQLKNLTDAASRTNTPELMNSILTLVKQNPRLLEMNPALKNTVSALYSQSLKQ